MYKKKNAVKVLITLICAIVMLTQSGIAHALGDVIGIDEGIANLDYNKYEVLASQGDVIENVVPKEGYSENGKFIVVEHTKKSIETSPIDISVINSVMDRTYPGSLLLADSDFTKNRPTPIITARKPIKLSIDLPGLGSDNTVKVKNPTYGKVTAAIDKLIDKWSEVSDTHTVPARTQYNETMVYSKEQLRCSLNIDVNLLNNEGLGIKFDAIHSGEKKFMVASYKQIFYTVSAELPSNPSDLFDDSVTFNDLQNKGVSNDAPPLLVNNVAYGRTIYVVLETESKSDKVEAAFKALIKGQKIEAGSEYSNIIENSSFTAVVLGGDSQEHNKIITTDFDEIRNVIKNNAAFSTTNPGYPISYTSTFVKDNSIAAVHNSTDYVETKITEYSQGKITLDHSGAYVAQFNVSWDEVSYDEKGNEVLTHKTWQGNDKDLTAHFSTVINMPANAKNIRIVARECTGLAWEWWRTVVDERNVPLTKNTVVSIWGTTLHPKTSITYEQ